MPRSSLTQKPWWCLSTGSCPLCCTAENRTSLDQKQLQIRSTMSLLAGTHSVSGARTNQLLKPAGDSPSVWYKTEIEFYNKKQLGARTCVTNTVIIILKLGVIAPKGRWLTRKKKIKDNTSSIILGIQWAFYKQLAIGLGHKDVGRWHFIKMLVI